MMKKLATPWGKSISLKVLEDLRGTAQVVEVRTETHGGIGVRDGYPMASYFRKAALTLDSWSWFEREVDWSMAAIALPDLFPERQQAAMFTMANWLPEIFERHFYCKLTIEQSVTIRQRELDKQLVNQFRFVSIVREKCVPGVVAVYGSRASDRKECVFYVPQAEFVNPLELVLDSFPTHLPMVGLKSAEQSHSKQFGAALA